VNSTELIYLFMYAISLYGIAILNLPVISIKESFETVTRNKISFDKIKKTSIQAIASAIEAGARSKYTAKEILFMKIKRLDSDFYNIIILFLPFLISMFVAYQTKSFCIVILVLFHFYFSFDLYRVFTEFITVKEEKPEKTDDKILEEILGKNQKEYLENKKIDLFLETWVINLIFSILFVAGLEKLC